MRITDILLENPVDSDKYIEPINQLLKKDGVNLPLELSTKEFGGKATVIDFFPTPGQQIQSLSDPVEGKLNGVLRTFSAKKIYKSNDLKNILGDKEEGTVNINKGELAEGYHAAAAFARLTKRPLDNISINDVLSIISRLENGQPLVLSGKEVESKIADRFELTIKLKPASWEAFKDPNTVSSMGKLLTSIITDANQETSRFAERFATNQQYDVARVIGDGVSEESLKKTDVSFENEREKKFVGYSLKVGTTKQIHQVGGGAVKDSKKGKKADPEQRFNILSQGLFAVDGRFPLANIDGVKSKFLQAKSNEEMQQIAYQAATASLNQNLQTDDEEKQFMRNLIGAMKYWMGRDDPSIKVKQFTTSGTYILDPQKVDSLIDNDQIDLVAKYTIEGNLPKIIIGDTVSGKPLVTIRTYRNSKGYIRNYIEKEKLWIDLTMTKHIPNASAKVSKTKPAPQSQPVRSGANKPVATNPKPALKISQPQMGQEPVDDIRFSGE
jgi:hypothetical protein